MKNQIYSILQRIGRSFMLPIAILPVAGLLLGIGQSFTNETMLETYGLMKIMGPGTLIHTILLVCSDCGNAIFINLPLIFAIGIAIGMAKHEKAVAAMSGAIAFFIMHTAIGVMIQVHGGSEALRMGSTTSVLGITSFQLGVFGGIIVGLGVAALHNRFYKVKLPDVFSFFGGTRFVPIISTVVYVLVGIMMYFIWQPIQDGMYAVGGVVRSSGYFGTFLYGVMERALIPFGLHHVFYMPFWQTSVGGTMEIAGKTIEGAQNIFFAQLADPMTTHFSVSATRFMAGKFPIMMFGLPGAALAMYKCAKPEKRKLVGGLLFSAALTSLLTGITEPIEFTFLFVAPGLYVIHCIFAGLSYMMMHVLSVCVGLTFSGGLVDFFLYGILQGQQKTNWMAAIPLGLIYFGGYYLIFSLLIRKFDLKTPGREEEEEIKSPKTEEGIEDVQSDLDISKLIMFGLGGKDNILDIDCCATRLRCIVRDADLIETAAFQQSGSHGLMQKGNAIQIIYGPQVTVIKSNFESYLESKASDEDINVDGIVSKNLSVEEVFSPIKGKVIPLDEVQDVVFSGGMLGDGFAVEPEEGVVYSPVNGTVGAVFDTKHALGICSEQGAELLIHLGLETVKLSGQFFKVDVEPGMKVQVGDRIASFELDKIIEAGYKVTTPVVINNSREYAAIMIEQTGNVSVGEKVMSLKK